MRESLVALELLVYQRRILAESLLQVCDDGQRLVIDLHEFSSIARGVEIFGDYHGHRLSDITHTALGQHRMTRDFQIRCWPRAVCVTSESQWQIGRAHV